MILGKVCASDVPLSLRHRTGAGEERIRIDVFAVKVAVRGRDPGDGKVQVKVAGPGVPGIADVTDDRTFSDAVAFLQPGGTGFKMGVIEDESFLVV